ncbi:MAG TPA: 5'-3' exonuclease H3TH domain-containing protein, partial [Verrucomicrobiae bacterium]|nr:5'-3' exonuclease H3TH domain-containing protein [Verrucomicrobiae bacterium]
MTKLIVLDGNSLINRAFYAIPLLTNQQGVFTNAAYGFTNMLFKIIENEKPCHLAVAFDKTKAHVRLTEYADYKANRKGTPDELRVQFPLVKEILAALDIPVLELEGYEADDVIGTLVRKSEERGWQNVIFTGDKDALQLISPQTVVALTKKGITETEVVDGEGLRAKYNLEPRQIIDLKGLMGDASDNIPGVPGVGEKTALKLLWEFGSVENLLDNLSQVAGKMQEKIKENQAQALLSKRLATIITDAPIELDLDRCALSEPDYPKLLELFKELEFKNLIKSITEKLNKGPERTVVIPTGFTEPKRVMEIKTIADWRDFSAGISAPVALYFAYDGNNPRTGQVTGVGIADSEGICGYLESFDDEALWQEFAGFAAGPVPKLVHDYKKAYSFLKAKGVELIGVEMDLMLAAYLINPASGKYSLEDLAFEQLNLVLNLEQGYLGIRSAVVQQLALIYWGKLTEMELWPLFVDMELPLARVLADMELTGVKLDRDVLEEMG